MSAVTLDRYLLHNDRVLLSGVQEGKAETDPLYTQSVLLFPSKTSSHFSPFSILLGCKQTGTESFFGGSLLFKYHLKAPDPNRVVTHSLNCIYFMSFGTK